MNRLRTSLATRTRSGFAAILATLLLPLTAAFAAPAARWADPPGGAVSGVAAAPVGVRVDERVELLTIVARLAGAREFLMANSASPYADRVAAHFTPFREHPAIAAYQAIRSEHGASYDAIASLAVHLDGVPNLAERIPFDQAPSRLDARWKLEPTRDFLVQLRAFAKASDARGFFDRERPFYDRCAERILPALAKAKAVEWFDGFFGKKAGANYVVIPGLLCGGGNYGVGVRFADGTPEELRPVLGIHRWDAEGLPVYGDQDVGTYIHELCHSYTNPIVDRHLATLEPSATRIYPVVARRMARMAYSSWQIVMYETFVRACVVRYMADVQSAAAGERQAKEERDNGFTWVPAIAERLGTYTAHRDRYATFEDFLPEIIATLSAEADTLVAETKDRTAKSPQILSMSPPNGATDVASTLTTLEIRFDRTMATKSWSFVGSKEDVPEMVGQPSWSGDGTSLKAKIRLVPGRTYHFWLNSERFQGFRSADGTPLEPVEVQFTVAPTS